jgi:digeranylgeranylglycerophospholipid reductase
MRRYDVIVVGAGPAGSICAKTIANKGLDVLLIEKRREIGVPVRCAEGVTESGLKEFIEPDERWICAEVTGANIYAPDGTKVTMADLEERGYVLERKIFDRALAQNAVEKGANLMVNTMATGLIKEDGCVAGITAREMGEELEMNADIIIGADGVESKVGRWAGIDTSLKLSDIGTCAEFLMVEIEIDQDYCDFFLGNEIAPGGYAWVFPKGERKANVGLGIGGDREGRAIDYLRRFMDRFPGGKVIEIIIGGVPLAKSLERMIGDGIMLIGDAARQANPLTGGGIYNAMYAGRIAGDVAVKAISNGDSSVNGLREYEKIYMEKIGKKNERFYRIKETVMRFSDEELNSLAHSLEGIKIGEATTSGLIKALLKKKPEILNMISLF